MRLARAVAIFAAWAAGLTPAAAYYHYHHFLPSGLAVQEKFDLNALPNRTLTFFVAAAEAGTLQYGPNDSFASIVSQVREAALAWNVETSDLRLAFGGLTAQPVQSTPGGLVTFDDLPPGVLGYGIRTVTDPGPNGTFWPITQGLVRLNRNVLPSPAGAGPSYLEAYYTTLVHEIGHTLGLQHTYTSSTMSTAVTRSTSRARILDADDVAGVSLLYGRTSSFGSIAGRVISDGLPVNMASVVALQPNGPAVSVLTNPDGAYRIDGLPPGNYWVYTQALPPGADFQYPTDPAGRPIPPTGFFETLFYRQGTAGTRDPELFTTIEVTRGGAVGGVDFAPQRRLTMPVHSVYTYSYLGQNAVSPAFLSTAQPTGTLVAWGTGLLNGSQATPGLTAQILGGSGSIYASQVWETGIALYLTYPAGAPPGPRHILFRLPNDAYVLPAAVNLAQKAPPSILGAGLNPDGAVTVTGSGMGQDSRVYFDGIPAAVRVPFSGTDQLGALVVAPPQGAGDQTATIVVYNADGQNSLFTQPQNPPLHSYGPSDPGVASVSPSAIPPGVTAMVEVNWPNARFLDNPVTLGLGSSDVYVRKVWLLGQTRLMANVSVASGAFPGATLLSVTCGFQSYTQPFGFTVQPANPKLPSIILPVANTGGGALYAGALANIYGVNLAPAAALPVVTVNDQPALVLMADAGQVTIQVPAGIPQGAAVLRLHNGVDAAFPVLIQIETAPPVVVSVTSGNNQTFDAARPAQVGELVNILLANVDPGVTGRASRLRVSIGGVETPALVVLTVNGQQYMYLAQLLLPLVPSGMQPLTVTLDGGTPSTAVFLHVR